MALSAFDDKTDPPGEAALAAALGTACALWTRLKHAVSERLDNGGEEWRFSGKSTGWGLRVKDGERIILYMTPCRGYFLASVVLGDRAVKAAHQAALPRSLVQRIDSSRRYVEGTGVRMEVRTAGDVKDALALALLKLAK